MDVQFYNPSKNPSKFDFALGNNAPNNNTQNNNEYEKQRIYKNIKK